MIYPQNQELCPGNEVGLWHLPRLFASLCTVAWILINSHPIAAATVSWDGGGGDGAWQNPRNWSGDVLPSPADQVRIIEGGDFTVTSTNNVSVAQLESDTALIISNSQFNVIAGVSSLTGPLTVISQGWLGAYGSNTSLMILGSLQVVKGTIVADAGASISLSGRVLMVTNQGQLVASGAGSSLAIAGPLNLVNSRVLADNGASVSWSGSDSLELSGLSALSAIGTGSHVDLSRISRFTGPPGSGTLFLGADRGGRVELGAVQEISVALGIQATGAGSVMDLSVMEQLSPGWSSNQVSKISAYQGASILLPQLKQINAAHGLDIEIIGSETVLALPNIQRLFGGQGSSSLSLMGTWGGRLFLGQIQQVEGRVELRATGAESAVEISGPAAHWNARGGNPGITTALMTATSGGIIRFPNLVELAASAPDTIYVQGAHSLIDLAGLTNVQASQQGATLSFTAEGGGRLELSAVTRLEGDMIIYANGYGSLVELPAPTGVWKSSVSSTVMAQNGGTVRMPHWTLLDASLGSFTLSAKGLGSVLDLSGLTDLLGGGPGTIELSARFGGRLDLGAVERINGWVTIMADGGDSLVQVANGTNAWSLAMDTGSLVINSRSGGIIDASALQELHCGLGGLSISSEGSGSSVDLSGIKLLSGKLLDVTAIYGGHINLARTETITGTWVAVAAQGTNSMVDMSGLTSLTLSTATNVGWIDTSAGGIVDFIKPGLLLANVAIVSNYVTTLTPTTNLTLWGLVGHSYWVESRDLSLPNSPWVLFKRTAQTNTHQMISGPPSANLAFRAGEFVADPPLLTLAKTRDQTVELTVFGKAGENYFLESADVLPTGPQGWSSSIEISMTNSFYLVPALATPGAGGFFRVRQ